MYIIIGLGNPGKKYENTRHNMGFIAIDRLAEKHNIQVDKIKFKALVGDGRIAGQKVLLVKPQTYMNLSGESVREVANYYKVNTNDIIVIYDDLDLPLGHIRIRKSGSAGTHNGMKSVVYQLRSDQFPRIRIGIGGNGDEDIINYVIGGFKKEEVKILEDTVDNVVSAIECVISESLDIAMNRYNTKKRKVKEKNITSNNETEGKKTAKVDDE
ncbi:MAG: aminoacyl-tRNA hydrolase [Clostridiales bacterium]|nr:aminoacyl-tRNA hydrolase [Clostridiales bacterium]MDD7347881.1 aminoacyl-tRNA hydrolase [Clostridiales bacterium]MDY4060096.1 aminoacyl-tRNA hydrolase [Anaerovoracaceae bacterium]